MVVTTVGVLLVFAATFVALRPPKSAPEKPMTWADIQQRREAHREAAARREPAARPPMASMQSVTDQPIGRLADAKEQLDRSMVGLPFQMSDSVAGNCRRNPGFPCDDLDQFLERMKAESRDPEWAPAIEQYIVKSLQIEEEGALRIRALECRRTRCALEVASEAQSGIQKAWKMGALDIRESWFAAWGTERDASTGVETRVWVHTWRRKSAGYDD